MRPSVWRGKSNDRAPGKILEPNFLDALDAAARTSSAIEMRLEEIEHFNSSTITAVIRMIEEARRGRKSRAWPGVSDN